MDRWIGFAGVGGYGEVEVWCIMYGGYGGVGGYSVSV